MIKSTPYPHFLPRLQKSCEGRPGYKAIILAQIFVHRFYIVHKSTGIFLFSYNLLPRIASTVKWLKCAVLYILVLCRMFTIHAKVYIYLSIRHMAMKCGEMWIFKMRRDYTHFLSEMRESLKKRVQEELKHYRGML